jgi:hypothetical protein
LNTYQITQVIEALKRWCLRVGVPTDRLPVTGATQ